LAVVAVAPSDGPSDDGSLESLLEGHGEAGERAGSAGRARSGVPEARTTTIDLSAAADPVPRRRGVVPLRRIVGARPPSGRWQARARRSARIGGWLVGAATVSAGLVALWVLLFTSVSGGDVWLGRPLTPTRHDENATQQNSVPGVPGAGSLRPSSTAPPKPSATAGTKVVTPSSTSGTSGSGSGAATSGSGSGAGSGGSGRNGADDPAGDDSGGSRTTASTSGRGSGGGSGSGSGGSGGHGADD
jgi:hypothetical protein